MITLLLLGLAPALADVAPCSGPYPTALMPVDGSADVPAATVPAFLVYPCATGSVQVTLTADTGDVQTTSVDVAATEIYWLPELVLTADTSYVLEATGADGQSLRSAFSTGTGELTPLDGAPSVEIVGSWLGGEGPNATVSLTVLPSPDVAGAVWSLARDGAQIHYGVDGPVSLVDAFEGYDEQEICYRVDQYQGHPSVVESSSETCVVLTKKADPEVAKSGCSVMPTDGSGVGLGALVGALLAWVVRRPWARRRSG